MQYCIIKIKIQKNVRCFKEISNKENVYVKMQNIISPSIWYFDIKDGCSAIIDHVAYIL